VRVFIYMSVPEFAADFAAIVSRSPLAPDRPLRWTLIANPYAGGFTIASRWKRHRKTLKAHATEALKRPPRPAGAEPSRTARESEPGERSLGALGLIPTQRPKHAGELVRLLLEEAAQEAATATKGTVLPLHLLVTAGGDGTSHEALSALFVAQEELRSRFVVLRLPMGTGNDGADARELSATLDLISKPSRIDLMPAVRLSTSTPGKGPFLAFNILSVGLDAYVTHKTNQMKGKLPGDSYRLWVDIATLFYDRIYEVAPMKVEALDATGAVIRSFRQEILLAAFGVSGNRCYGANKPILPDERNVCVIPQMSLFKKIALKPKITSGHHAKLAEIMLFSTHKLVLDYDKPILSQTDGEVVALDPCDFPITMELTEKGLPVLRAL